MNRILAENLPRHTLMVFAALEVLTLLALSPRTQGSEPFGFSAVACLRLCGLMFLGSLLHSHPAKSALWMLTLWGMILLPPELWAYGIEARESLPPTLISSLVAGYGAYAFARFFPNAAQVFPILGVVALFANGFQPNLYSLPMLMLLGSSMLLLVWQLLRHPPRSALS